MPSDFPYQLAAFLEAEPTIGEPVYYGPKGWYPQIALKRRFKANELTEAELIKAIQTYCDNVQPFTIHTGGLTQPDRMPVKILEVASTPELINFHRGFISFMSDRITSRYPERDGENYLPHITAEYNGKMVIDTAPLRDRTFHIQTIFLLKDTVDQNSVAYARFALK